MRTASRGVLLLTVLATAGGCVMERAAGALQPTDLILTGRVVSAREVIGMMGDVAVVWNAYLVAPQDGSGSRTVVVDAPADCPVTGPGVDVVRFRLQRERRMFGFTKDSDRAAVSDLFVVSCERLPSAGAF